MGRELHVAEYAGKCLAEVLHSVLGVLAGGLRLTALALEGHPRGRRHGRRLAATDRWSAAHCARLRCCSATENQGCIAKLERKYRIVFFED